MSVCFLVSFSCNEDEGNVAGSFSFHQGISEQLRWRMKPRVLGARDISLEWKKFSRCCCRRRVRQSFPGEADDPMEALAPRVSDRPPARDCLIIHPRNGGGGGIFSGSASAEVMRKRRGRGKRFRHVRRNIWPERKKVHQWKVRKTSFRRENVCRKTFPELITDFVNILNAALVVSHFKRFIFSANIPGPASAFRFYFDIWRTSLYAFKMINYLVCREGGASSCFINPKLPAWTACFPAGLFSNCLVWQIYR